ncbi:MAG: M23 family metallopeptidase [Candidatus Pacebacteria bacterium]|nr:M23 family metallopeptidase [Candidatus Paceibacterota bacterium]
MANESSYQLKNLSVPQIIDFVTKLNNDHFKVDRSFLDLREDKKIDQLNIVVDYNDNNTNKSGYISRSELTNILVSLNSLIKRLVNENTNNPPFILPTKDGLGNDFYQPFNLSGDFSTNIVSSSPDSVFKQVINAFYQVVNGNISKEETIEEKKTGDNISDFSYNLRAGDPIKNWTKKNGVKSFINQLKAHKDNQLVPDNIFGSNDEYRFEDCLGALDDFYEKLQKVIKEHDNYNHPEGSNEKKAINNLENRQNPFFGNRRFETFSGKLINDDIKIKEYEEIVDAAIKALGEDIPLPPTSAGAGDDADGGDSTEEEEDKFKKAREENNIIDFDQLNIIFKDRLVNYIYEEYYQESIADLDNKFVIRKALLKLISDKVDANINLRVELRNKLNTTWSDQIQDDVIINDEALISLIDNYIIELANSLELNKEKLDEDLKSAVSELDNFKSADDKEEDKPQITGAGSNTANIIVQKLIEQKIDPEITEEKWKVLTQSQKVDIWMRLSLSDRAEIIKQALIDRETYSRAIAEIIINDQLNQRNLKRSENLNLEDLTFSIQESISAELINIPPTELVGDPRRFIQSQRNNISFFRGYSKSLNLLEIELRDYLRNFPEQVLSVNSANEVSFEGVTTLEEALRVVNPNLNIADIDQKIEFSSKEIFEIIKANKGFNVTLPADDQSRSINEINNYLRNFLLSDEGRQYLFILSDEKQLRLFISKIEQPFISAYSRDFMPLIEPRLYQAERVQVLQEINRLTGINGIEIDDAVHFILTEAVMSQVDPEKYINSLSDEKLLTLFNAPKDLDPSQIDQFRGFVKEYLKSLKGLYNLDELIDDSAEYDEEDFDEGITFYQQQSRRDGSPINSGRSSFQAVTAQGYTLEELNEFEAEEADYLARRMILAQLIWEERSKEEQALLRELEAENSPVYEQEKILRNQRSSQQQGTQDKKGRNKKGGNKTREIFKKGVSKAINKGIVNTATSAIGLIPGVGPALAGILKALPISDKAKTIIIGGVVGTALALIYKAFTSIGGLISWATGGIFSGNVGSWMGNIGGGSSSSSSSSSSGGYGTAGTSGSGTFSPLSGKADGSTIGSGDSTLGSGSSSVGQSILSTTAGQAVTALGATAIGGGILVTAAIHSAFLMNVPEVNLEFEGSSKYAILEKKALEGTEFDDPTEITYELSITAREGYELVISAPPDDEFSFDCNEETRNIDCPTDTNSPEFSNYRDFVSKLVDLEGTVVSPGEKIPVGSYSVPFNGNYDDASVKNTFTVNFQVNEEGIIVGEESAKATEQICFGECPALKEGCWPTNGEITVTPYYQEITKGFATHANVDSFDIAGQAGSPIYSTSDGEACFYTPPAGFDDLYGKHVLVKSGSYALFYAHLSSLEGESGTCTNVSAGTKIGTLGNTGNSTGPHLHWEMRILSGDRYTSRIPNQGPGMASQTLLEQHSPLTGKGTLNEPVNTCYD